MLRDKPGTIYTDALFADLFPQRGQPALAPWQLALVTLMQFAENLSDRQAADAVRSRIEGLSFAGRAWIWHETFALYRAI